MRLSQFDYELPQELIAQYPLQERHKARLLVLDRSKRQMHDTGFEHVVDYLQKGDALILNNTRVVPARLFGRRATGAKVEIFLLDPLRDRNGSFEALLRPSSRLKQGEHVVLESGDEAEILERGEVGRFVKFNNSLLDIVKKCGHTPLPPYIKRKDKTSDQEDYQTVYASYAGATASPTAGLHFTKKLLEEVEARDVAISYVTLHTSYGTFAPVKTEDVEHHTMHREFFSLPKETAALVRTTKKSGGKVVAVGTTTTRVLEHCADHILSTDDEGQETNREGYTDLFIYPPYQCKIVDRLITNFHLPKSTLLLLVSAFAGRDFIFEAYRHAIQEQFRFFSYGDAMLIV
jgi:S-adenosylmethionine:tRNA ribosyltransferase-isomerase